MILDARRATSKTESLIRHIAEQIECGELKPGDRLPSTQQLCRHYGVSVTVVRHAIQWLKAVGYVQGVLGVGVFVVEQGD